MDSKKEIPVMSVNSRELEKMLGCGRRSARKVGEAAGAKVSIGGRVLWNVAKIRAYLDETAGGGEHEARL